jgi:hypothetical protein
LSAGILALVILLAITVPAIAADTGTYRIKDYIVTLEPQSSGEVQLTCEQTWQVTGGHIPWITVGLPNSDFSIKDSSGAISDISPANSSGWSGVRLDLDQDYQPGEIFNIKFTVLQGHLLERLPDKSTWRINYTPGWYDNAVTDHLKISIVAPVDIESYSRIDPQPTLSAGDTVMWEQTNISKGGGFTIKIECMDGSFLVATSTSSEEKSVSPLTGILVIVVIAIIFIAIIALIRRKREQERDKEILRRIHAEEKKFATDNEAREKADKGFQEYVEKKRIEPDAEGRYYDRGYGGYITPIIWAAILNRQNQDRTKTNTTRSSGCACACVSCACACACACAGGGGAGCAKKGLHRCESCQDTKSILHKQDN